MNKYTIARVGNADSPVLTVGRPSATFDGRTFEVSPESGPWLYLAWRARRGDAAAAELLTAYGIVIRDAGGGAYWPTEADAPAVVGGAK